MHYPVRSSSRIALAASAVALLVLAGCASQVPLDGKSAPVSAAEAAAQAQASRIAAAKAELAKVKPSVYFDFDKFDIKPESQATITAFSNYMKVDGNARLVIEGNADERGTTEYNLALGQKRAEAVRKALNLLGVADNQIEAVSFGEEKPAVMGSNEAAYAKNRRVEFNYR